MAWTDLLPPHPSLQMDSIWQGDQQILITLVSTRESDVCPTCQTRSCAGHGWFTRRIQTLPCSGRVTVFLVQAQHFRCLNPACPRKTLRMDWEAIENALLFASSQGQVEGQVNRLKVFKRQGYGRSSPALLQARLAGASELYQQ